MTAVAARQCQRAKMEVHAGQAVQFLVIDSNNREADSRIRVAPLLEDEQQYDVDYYREHLRRGINTVVEPLLEAPAEKWLGALKKEKLGDRVKAVSEGRDGAQNVQQLDLFDDA